MKQSSHPIRNMVIGVFVLLGTIALVFGVRYFTHLPKMNITDVEVRGGETVNLGAIQTLATDQLAGEYLKLIPKSFVWLYPYDAIAQAVAEVERVYNVRIDRHRQTLHVTFDEYEPFALWCAAVDEKQCIFLTNTGYGFAPAPELSGGSFTRFITPGHPPTPETVAILPENFALLTELVDLLARNAWFVEVVEFDKEYDAFLHLVGGSELKVTLRETPRETIKNLQTILGSEEFSHLTPGNFKYIDLRFGNKVFVNEHGAPVEQIATSTATSTEQ